MHAYIISIGNYVIRVLLEVAAMKETLKCLFHPIADIPQNALILLAWKRQSFTTTTAYPGQRNR